MSTNLQSVRLTGLARALVQAGKLSESKAQALTQSASVADRSFVEGLIASGQMGPLEIAEFLSLTFSLPLLDLAAVDPESLPVTIVDRKFLQSRKILPLRQRGNRLAVAVSDPSNTRALDEVKFQTGLTPDPIVVEEDKLTQLLSRLGQSAEMTLKTFIEEDLALELGVIDASEPEENAPSSDVDDAPIVRFIQKVLTDAIADGASDIHFEPYDRLYRIRTRIDGVLTETAQLPIALKERVASRLKIISRMDIAEKRVPQDGRFKLALSKERTIEFRVSSLPTIAGEKIALRILDSGSVVMGIDALGYSPDQKACILHEIQRPHGMILVTGPTGSGKTVSLYSFLQILNQGTVNISTVEDPAEIQLPGVNQVNVNERAGLEFATALRAFLRQDPDIIMVGEIRDPETAEIAVKAAQTGHLLLSTLHTNDAPSTLTRLVAMGIPAFNVASSVNLITAQRLARRLCACKVPAVVPDGALLGAGFAPEDLDGRWRPLSAVGCTRCKGTGYKGRVGLFQVMPISDAMRRLLMRGSNSIEIADQARLEGIADLRRAGLTKVMQGITSLEEVMAVTND